MCTPLGQKFVFLKISDVQSFKSNNCFIRPQAELVPKRKHQQHPLNTLIMPNHHMAIT
jgi:hypothetical protein